MLSCFQLVFFFLDESRLGFTGSFAVSLILDSKKITFSRFYGATSRSSLPCIFHSPSQPGGRCFPSHRILLPPVLACFRFVKSPDPSRMVGSGFGSASCF